MKKRIVSALLALVLILSNFTGGGLIEHVHVEAAANSAGFNGELQLQVNNSWSQSVKVSEFNTEYTLKYEGSGDLGGKDLSQSDTWLFIKGMGENIWDSGIPDKSILRIKSVAIDGVSLKFKDNAKCLDYLVGTNYDNGAYKNHTASRVEYALYMSIFGTNVFADDEIVSAESRHFDSSVEVTFEIIETSPEDSIPLYIHFHDNCDNILFMKKSGTTEVEFDLPEGFNTVEINSHTTWNPYGGSWVDFDLPDGTVIKSTLKFNGTEAVLDPSVATYTYSKTQNDGHFDIVYSVDFSGVHNIQDWDNIKATATSITVILEAVAPELGQQFESTGSFSYKFEENTYDSGALEATFEASEGIVKSQETLYGAHYPDITALITKYAELSDVAQIDVEVTISDAEAWQHTLDDNSNMITPTLRLEWNKPGNEDNHIENHFNADELTKTFSAAIPADATAVILRPWGGNPALEKVTYNVKVTTTLKPGVEPKPDLPTCDKNHDETWTVIDNPEKSEANGAQFKIKLANGDKVYKGDILELHVLGTADVEGKSKPGIRLYVASGENYKDNNLTGSTDHMTAINNGTFEFDVTVNVGVNINQKLPETSAGDSIVFNSTPTWDATYDGYNSAEITHFAYKITHTHTPGDTFGYDGKYHWKACSVCSKPVGDTKEEHNFADGSLKCSVCHYKHAAGEIAIDLKRDITEIPNGVTFDEDGNVVIKGDTVPQIFFNLDREVEYGKSVTVHILASANDLFRFWLVNNNGKRPTETVDATKVGTELYEMTVEIPLTFESDAEKDNGVNPNATRVTLKGKLYAPYLPEMTIYHIGIVYPECEHPADKQVTQFDLKNHWKRCLVCNEIIKDTTTAHTMVDNKCSGCAFEHYPDEVEIELTDENIRSGNDGAITYEEGAVKVASNSVEWMNFNFGRTLLNGEKVSVHVIGNIIGGSANQNGYLRAWLGDTNNYSTEQCTDINKASDGTFYNGYFQIKREFENTGSANAVALKANAPGATLPELVINHVAVVVPECPHNESSPMHQAWLDGKYFRYESKDNNEHEVICTLCEKLVRTESHSAPADGQYTPSEDGENHTYTCSVCNATITEAHTEGDYKNDDPAQHWKVCADCGGKIDSTVAEHVLTYKDNKDGKTHTVTCDTCGYKNESEAHVESQNKYDEDDDGRYHVCEYCDARLDVTEHTYKWTDLGNGQHVNKCSVCGHEQTGSIENHTYEDGVCSKCGYAHPEAEHTWGSWIDDGDGANHSRTCSICHKTETAAHTQGEQKSDENNHWYVCSECNAEYNVTKHVLEYVTDGANGHHQECTGCDYKTATVAHSDAPADGKYTDSEDGLHHTYKCAQCGDTVTAAHNYKEGAYKNTPTDHWQVCKDCDGESVRENHKYIDGSDRCSVCNYWNHQHTLEWKDDGENHWQECSNPDCDYKTEKEPHVLGDKYDYNDTQHSRTCAVCGKTVAENHQFGDYKFNAGMHWHECSVCQYKTDYNVHTLDDASDATSHWQECTVEGCDYQTEHKAHTPSEEYGQSDTQHWSVCTECGEKYAYSEHTLAKDLKHDAEGHWKYCEVCGKEETKSDHVWDDGEITVEPTETTEGVKTYTCTECGETKTETVPKSAHKHVAGEEWKHDEKTHWHECVSETCDDKSAKLDEAAHTEDEGTVTKAATEAEEGVMTFKCTVCGAVTRTETIPKVKHTHVAGEEWKYDEKTHWHECVSETCDDKTAKLDEAAHTEDEGTVTKAATETEEGVKTFKCTVCGAVTRTEAIPKVEHTHVAGKEWKHDEKTHWHECVSETCDDKTAKLDEAEHVWDDGKVTVEPTYTKEGERLYTCEVCGETKTETVPVKGHEHSTVTKSDENGHWKECTICGETVGEVEAHTPGEWITDSEATSTEAGKRHKECTVCGYVTDVLEVPATGDIDVEVPTVGNVPKVELPAEQQEVLKNAIIDEEDVEAIESGASIDIELTVENAESTIAPEDKAVSDEAAVQGNYTHVRYLDINLTKVVTDASGASTSEEISELGKEVKIVITVPLALAKPTGRDFAVIRVHDGEATVLKDLDSDPKTVTISTNLFSSYTLVYVDTTPVPSTPGGMIGHVHVITGLQNDAHYHWRGCFLCSMRVDYEPHRFVDGVCVVCGYRDPDYVPEVEEEEPAEAPDEEVTVVDAPAEGTEQGGDSEGTPEVTDTPADLPETEAEVVEVKEDDETSENPKTGVVFTGIGAVMAAIAALVAKRK